MPFATLPIMTKYLNLIDYGYFALFSLCLIPFLILTEYGAGYVIYSNWFDFNDNDRGKLVFSLLIVGTALTLAIVLLFSLIGDTIFPIIIGENWNNIKSLKIYLFVTAFTYIPVTIFNYWVVIEKTAYFQEIESFCKKNELGKINFRKEENLITYPNILRAKKILKWKPKINFRQGLIKTIRFYEKNFQ